MSMEDNMENKSVPRSEMVSGLKRLLIASDYRFEMGTKYCKFHRDKHTNCENCSSEQGCKRMNQLMEVMSVVTYAKHDTPEQIVHNQEYVTREFKKILKKEEETNKIL